MNNESPLDEEERDELVRKAQSGDQVAFQTLFLQFQQRLLGLLMHIVQNKETAEDLRQETYCKAWRSIRMLKHPSRIESWLLATAKHLALDYQRHRRLEEKHNVAFDPSEHDLSVEHANPEARTLYKEAFFEIINTLKPLLRTIVLMSAAGFTIAEITRYCFWRLGHKYTEQSVRTLLSQAHQMLRKSRDSQVDTARETRKGN